MKQERISLHDLEDLERARKLSEEWLSVEKKLDHAKILKTIVFFGSARIEDSRQAQLVQDKANQIAATDPDNPLARSALKSAAITMQQSWYYEDARKLASKVCRYLLECNNQHTKLITGGGPGIMEAASRGASEVGESSIGLNIIIPKEQTSNRYISKELLFSFHYFSMRKMHFVQRAAAIVVFPGGFGTLDELLEVLTLMQTGKTPRIPIILYGESFWKQAVNFKFLAEQQLIEEDDLKLFSLVNDVESAFKLIRDFIQCAK